MSMAATVYTTADVGLFRPYPDKRCKPLFQPLPQKTDSNQKKYRFLAGLHLKDMQARLLTVNCASHLRQNCTSNCCMCCCVAVSSGVGRLAV